MWSVAVCGLCCRKSGPGTHFCPVMFMCSAFSQTTVTCICTCMSVLYAVDKALRGQIHSRINQSIATDCRTVLPRRLSSTAYKTVNFVCS